MVSADTTMMIRFCQVMNMPPQSRMTLLLYGLSNAYGIGPNQSSIAFCSRMETPMVAINGSNSLPRSRSGAKIAAFTSQPSAAPHERDADTREVIAAEYEGKEIRRERADGYNVRVREIDLDENAVDKSEPQCHEDIEAPENYAI